MHIIVWPFLCLDNFCLQSGVTVIRRMRSQAVGFETQAVGTTTPLIQMIMHMSLKGAI